MTNATAVLLDHHGTIRYATHAALTRIGFSSIGEVLDRRPKDLWGGYMDPSVYQTAWRTAVTGEPTLLAVTNKSRNSTWDTNRLHIVQISDPKGTQNPYYLGYTPPESSMEASRRFFSVWNHGGSHTTQWLSDILGLAVSKSPYQMVHTGWVIPLQQQFAARYADVSLIEQAQQTSAAFAELYQKYYASVAHFLSAKVGYNTELAEELTQETFLQAFRYLPTYTPGYASYQTYLYRVANSRLVSYLRKQRETYPLDGISEPLVHNQSGAEQLDLSYMLDTARGVLSTAEYHAVEAFYIREESVREISIAMGKSPNAVKLLLSRARKKLSQALPRV